MSQYKSIEQVLALARPCSEHVLLKLRDSMFRMALEGGDLTRMTASKDVFGKVTVHMPFVNDELSKRRAN